VKAIAVWVFIKYVTLIFIGFFAGSFRPATKEKLPEEGSLEWGNNAALVGSFPKEQRQNNKPC
jgi:hypothetical protein